MLSSDPNLTCVVSFFSSLFSDMGVEEQNKGPAFQKLLQFYLGARSDKAKIKDEFKNFISCVETEAENNLISIERIVAVSFVILVVICVVFIVVFCLAIFSLANPEVAVASFFLFVIALALLNYYTKYRLQQQAKTFGSKFESCLSPLESSRTRSLLK